MFPLRLDRFRLSSCVSPFHSLVSRRVETLLSVHLFLIHTLPGLRSSPSALLSSFCWSEGTRLTSTMAKCLFIILVFHPGGSLWSSCFSEWSDLIEWPGILSIHCVTLQRDRTRDFWIVQFNQPLAEDLVSRCPCRWKAPTGSAGGWVQLCSDSSSARCSF